MSLIPMSWVAFSFMGLSLVAGTSSCASAPQGASSVATGQSHSFKVEEIVSLTGVIWGFDFLPDGRIILSERSGSMFVFDPKSKKLTTLKGVPKVHAEGQGGLLDVRVHPDFKSNQWVYVTYAKPVTKKTQTTALARARLSGHQLEQVENLFVAGDTGSKDIHFGSRIEFDGAGHVFITIGDRGEREKAQSLSDYNGKILRLKEDGTVPADNPYVKTQGAKPEIWSYGHRNPQGLAREASTGALWEAELGPRGGDEVNLIRPATNYGWPVVTYGREYWGPSIGEGKEKAGMQAPVEYWVPSISPSGIAFYTGDRFSNWKGNLFLGNLSGSHLRRLVIKDGKVTEQEALLENYGRIRSVRSGPDGALYLSTDDGRLTRLIPEG